MARLNNSTGRVDQKDEGKPSTPNVKGDHRDDEEELEEEDNGANMSALINYASGKKASPVATPSSSLGILQKVTGGVSKLFSRSLGTPSKPTEQGDDVLEKPVETDGLPGDVSVEHTPSEPGDVIMSGTADEDLVTRLPEETSEEKGSLGRSKPDIYDIMALENHPPLQSPRSIKRKNRRSEVRRSIRSYTDVEESVHDSSEGNSLAQDREPSNSTVDSRPVPKATVNGIRDILETQNMVENIDDKGPPAEPEAKPEQAKRGRGRPRKTGGNMVATRTSKRKAEEELGEQEKGDDEESAVEKPSKTVGNTGRAKKKQKKNAEALDVVPAAQAATRSTRSIVKSTTHNPPEQTIASSESDHGDKGGNLKKYPVRSKTQQEPPEKRGESLRTASPDLDANTEQPDGAVEDILDSPTPQGSLEPETAISRNARVAADVVMEEVSDKNSDYAVDGGDGQEDAEEEEEEEEDENEDEDEEEDEVASRSVPAATPAPTHQSLGGKPITGEDIKSMMDLMKFVCAKIQDKVLSKQQKPDISTERGQQMAKWTKKVINEYKDLQTFDRGAGENSERLKRARGIINAHLKKINVGISRLVDSNLLEKHPHETRSKVLEDLYAHNIPGLVGLVSVAFETYKSEDDELATDALVEIAQILGYLHDLCKIARKPKEIQPKQTVYQLSNPTRRLLPIVRTILNKCNTECDKRAEAFNRAKRRVEQEAKRLRTQASQPTQTTQALNIPQSSNFRKFDATAILLSHPEPETDVQRAARAEREAWRAADEAKESARHYRLWARRYDDDPFNETYHEKVDTWAEDMKIKLDRAVKAEETKVEVCEAIGLKPSPSRIENLIAEFDTQPEPGSLQQSSPKIPSHSFQDLVNMFTELAPTNRSTQMSSPGFEDRNLRKGPTPEWRDEATLILLDGLEQLKGPDKYEMIMEQLPMFSLDDIFSAAREFKDGVIERWHEERKKNPSCPRPPQWVFDIN